MIKNNNFNLIQTQNLLDLELNELKPIFYPKLQLNLIEINNDRQSIDQPISSKLMKGNDKKTKQSIDYKILLDDRCIVGYVLQKNYIIDDNIFNQIRLRFFKEIRYSGKNYYKRLFSVLLEQSIKTGKTIIIDKNINLERIGENTKWKIDFTNYLKNNCRSSYEWLNHMTLNKLRQIGLLILRNHLNQQMIKQERIEINTKLQKEVQYHIEKYQIKNSAKKLESIKLKTDKNQSKTNFKKLSNQLNKTNFKLEELNDKKLQSILIELNCLQNYKYLNHQLIEFKDNSDKFEIEEQDNNLKLVNELNKKIKKFESTQYEDILREEQLKNIEFNDQEEDDDELAKATQNYKQKKSKNRKWPKFKRLERNFKYKFEILKLRIQSTFRRKLFDLQIKYKEIEEHQLSTDQLNVATNLELCLPANVPYCQTGRSSLIAALKQFNWSHTQGPFVYNNCNKNFY